MTRVGVGVNWGARFWLGAAGMTTRGDARAILQGPGKGLLRGHSGRPGGVGRTVLRGGDARNSPWRADHERRTLLYKYCVSRHPMSRSPRDSKRFSPSRRITYVRSVTLQRRTRRGAV